MLGLVVWRLRTFVGHLQEQQVRELLHHSRHIAHAVVAQHVAVVPELLYQEWVVVFMRV